MDNSTDTLEPQKLQWIKGDKIGNVEIVVTDDGEWTTFESGARIASGLIGEFMMPIDGEPMDLSMTSVQAPPPPKLYQGEREPIKGQSPIRILFDKQKKVDEVTLTLDFSITLPKKDIFDIISVSFDEEEVTAELNAFIKNQINDKSIKESLENGIQSLIEERYKGI